MPFHLNKYTLFREFEDKIIGINLLKNIIFLMDSEKYNLLKKNRCNLENLTQDNPLFFSVLNKLGIILQEKQNIYKELLFNNRLIVFDNKTFHLTINPTLNCNCSCWYCYETHSKKIISEKVEKNIEKLIHNLIIEKGIKNLYLDWFGGEPLLCYKNKLVPISFSAKEVCDKYNIKFESGITTNGYLLNYDMISFFREVNMNTFQITLDGDKSMHDITRVHNNKYPTYEKIIENICLLAEHLNPNDLILRINYTKESFHKITNIINSVPENLRKNIKILLQQVWQDQKKYIPFSETEAIKKKFENAGFRVKKDVLNLKCHTCYADLFNQAIVNYDGRVFKCTARNFEKEKEDGILNNEGQIDWDFGRLASFLSNATFENDECKECIYLPVCFGPCSKKVAHVKGNMDEFRKICFRDGIESTLDYLINEFINSGEAIANLIPVEEDF